ncbi:MAG: aspartate aminotransferase-like enzyme, partial [Planctomycetota bacterium]
ARSPTVSCIDANGADVEALAKLAAAAGFKMDKGYGDLKGKAFRIGHMGDHTMARLESLLNVL